MTPTTEQEQAPELVAAVDLGSNSFHMIVCSVHKGQLKTLDRLREMVRLASGLNDKKILDEPTQQRALACLERFGQRIQNFSESNVRIVGTNTLRTAKNSKQFLQKAERAIGYPIHIISGIEEARLIYQGVAHSLQSNANRRLVMDIGGGSTEYIIGTNSDPAQKESLRMGCVTVSNQFFTDGAISSRRFKQAQIFVNQQLNTYRNLFNHNRWDEAIGASGSIRAIRKVLLATEWSKGGITLDGLEKLKEHALNCKHVSELDLPELDQERLPVFMGGLVILYTTFKTLDIDKMSVSDGALREGLIYDYLGRMFNHDVRSDTVQLLAEHYHTDRPQTERIKTTIEAILQQVGPFLGAQSRIMHQYLNWAAELHEISRNIAHSQYHKHGAYIIKHGDLAGFSQQDQNLLATLVLSHRRKIPLKTIKHLPPTWNKLAIYMVIILRIAVILQRNRSHSDIPEFTITLTPKTIDIEFPEHWLDNAPLTQADLKLEEAYLAKAKFSLHTS
ncbi:exopolyphosphatase/guanosine-5'-triphosphate,3'-diphosphate pyrophosphatase [Bathymodiolus japonicus methanotrophic gill symbiont]|uniref:exopolyphosphatase n=1 Tax=Bathymodiolus japonicus methanotrophic gill symbiont TaxID=113269 RepID=UPI001B6DDEB8|nr:exopolyphosphatase [Bathymodiolus japonicus methanotrophic gill symbiont]GFO72584.1 exopolyphosphatase/guanosine-5'-triphosphate,3'-diphosphate pyrophosphatase [Bathymodiolus japonicus methanotrophic gill symbiont]